MNFFYYEQFFTSFFFLVTLQVYRQMIGLLNMELERLWKSVVAYFKVCGWWYWGKPQKNVQIAGIDAEI
jgi:hypothetical protein